MPTTPRSKKPRNRPDCQPTLDKLRAGVPPRYRGLVESMADGSRAAAVKLHCLQCVGYLREEVRLCTCKTCPMWPFRPYQPDAEDGEPDTEDAGPEIVGLTEDPLLAGHTEFPRGGAESPC